MNKKIVLNLFFNLITIVGFTQTVNFSPNGNVGIGIIEPENAEGWFRVLEVHGDLHSKIIASSSDVKSGLWAHNVGYYGAPAGGITGTASNHPFSIITNKTSKLTILPNGNVGIGTGAPDYLLTVDAGNSRRGIAIRSDGNEEAYSDFSFTINPSTVIPAGLPQKWIISHRKDGYFSNNLHGQASLEFYAALYGGGYLAPLSFKSNGDVILASNVNANAGNVGIGITNPAEKLAVNGKIRAREIKVESANWPDYVFSPAYKLLSLDHTALYIKENGHLPEMPSASETEKNGISLGEMNGLLLKKIEELTLHLIEKDREIRQLKDDNVSINEKLDLIINKVREK